MRFRRNRMIGNTRRHNVRHALKFNNAFFFIVLILHYMMIIKLKITYETSYETPNIFEIFLNIHIFDINFVFFL